MLMLPHACSHKRNKMLHSCMHLACLLFIINKTGNLIWIGWACHYVLSHAMMSNYYDSTPRTQGA